MFKRHIPLRDSGVFTASLGALNFDIGIKDREDALRPGQTALNAVGDIDDLADLIREFVDQIREDKQSSPERQFATNDKRPAVTDQNQLTHLRQ